jgi:hypothetical protein
MSVEPEYGKEEEIRLDRELKEHPRDELEHEVKDRELEEEALLYLNPEDNEAHAPGKVCPRCGTVITAVQDARRLPDGQWAHEVCPPVPAQS